ncbi:MAG: peptidylprolyl isomerase, partial [Phycisphaeraceae bacterium]|nr:peptidylprolyl isomerase [Phycisphaeraceae bacterium]
MNRRSTKFTCFPRHRTPRAGKGEPQRPVFEPLEQRTLLDAAAAPDLVQFAQALTDSGDVTYYGAAWCINCANQSREFEDGAQFLPFVEVTNPDRTGNDIATSEGISAFPTWDFDGTRVEGLLTVEQISTFSGINIPMTEDPFVAPIADKTLLSGTALHIPLDGYHPASKPLFYEVTVVNANGAQVTSTLFEDNRSATIDFTNFGDVTFQLFDQRVPRAANNFAALAELEFYEDKIVHRAVPGFVMQFG